MHLVYNHGASYPFKKVKQGIFVYLSSDGADRLKVVAYLSFKTLIRGLIRKISLEGKASPDDDRYTNILFTILDI